MAVTREQSILAESACASGSMPLEQFVRMHYLPGLRAWRNNSCSVSEDMISRYVLPYLGSMSLNSISAEILELWLKTLESFPIQPRSRYFIFNHARNILDYAVELGCLRADSPFRKLAVDAGTCRIKESTITPEELERLDQFLVKSGKVSGKALRFMLLTGLSTSETVTALWRNVDKVRGTIKVQSSENTRPRTLYLDARSRALLESMPRYDGVEHIFVHGPHHRTFTNLFYAWRAVRRVLNRPDLNLRELQRVYAPAMSARNRREEFLKDDMARFHQQAEMIQHEQEML